MSMTKKEERERERRFSVKTRADSGKSLSMSWVKTEGDDSINDENCSVILMGWKTKWGYDIMRFVRVDLPDGRTVFTTDPESYGVGVEEEAADA